MILNTEKSIPPEPFFKFCLAYLVCLFDLPSSVVPTRLRGCVLSRVSVRLVVLPSTLTKQHIDWVKESRAQRGLLNGEYVLLLTWVNFSNEQIDLYTHI